MLTPRNKRVKKETVINESTPNSTSATQTKTVLRRDGVTPRKTVVTDYTNNYNEKGDMYGGSNIDSIVKTRYNKEGKPKTIIIKTPINETPMSKIRPNGDTPLSTSPIVKFQ